MRRPLELLKPARAGLTVLLCVVALGACAREIGRLIDADAVDTLTPGKSTYADAMRKFGKPVRVRGHGSETIAHWHYLKDTPDGTDHDSLKIMFDKDGRMVRIVEWLDSGEEDDET